MLRLIATASFIAWAGFAHADPHLVYTHHAIRVDVHDLDLTREADLRILKTRIERAATAMNIPALMLAGNGRKENADVGN